MLLNSRVFLVSSLVLAAACGGTDSTPDTVVTLRPGVKDSSKSFQGTASANETAFWEAVRRGDDPARAKAVASLKQDAAADPKNAYSGFLAAANVYMPPSGLLAALNSLLNY
jgi:hypothetical protein